MHEPDSLPDRESKTSRKKQMLALQDLGKVLVELPAPQLAKIPLESPLAEAIAEARILKSHEAKRRQLQYIGKLMRHVDLELIQEALDKVLRKDTLNKAKFHQVERWRDKLIAEGDETLQIFSEKFPQADHQRMRQLIRNAKEDHKINKNSGAATALFRYLCTLLSEDI
jgi:ribosome-associated protein